MEWGLKLQMDQRGALAGNHNAAAPCAATLSALLETEAICHGPLAGVKVLTGLCEMMKKTGKRWTFIYTMCFPCI